MEAHTNNALTYRLAAAIRQAVDDAQLRGRAAALGEKIRGEDGVGNAVAIIKRVMAARSSGSRTDWRQAR